MYICTQGKICSHFHATKFIYFYFYCYSMLNLLQEEVWYFLSISIVMRAEVHILRYVCTSPSPQGNEPVNRLTFGRSGSPNQNL